MMKRIKSWHIFLEDGVAAANASTTGGMGGVSNATVGSLAGVPAGSGSGDRSTVLSSKPRVKGDPSQVSDLRDLEDSDVVEVDDLKKD